MSLLPTEVIECPYCGEPIELIIDDTVRHQRYVEDCSVCCRPIDVDVVVDDVAGIQVRCSTDNET